MCDYDCFMAVLKVSLLCLLLLFKVTHKTFDTYTVILVATTLHIRVLYMHLSHFKTCT